MVLPSNSHWRAQSFSANPQSLKNGTDSGPTYSGRFDENLLTTTLSMQVNQQNPLESHPGDDILCKSMDQEKELVSRAMGHRCLFRLVCQPLFRKIVRSPTRYLHLLLMNASAPLMLSEFMIEGGTISTSNTYSQGLLNSLTQALQTIGLNLSQASISVQINLGKQLANKEMAFGPSVAKV